jgi:hypothetical protein
VAIETEHKGIIFRSRLEARWAHFFDAVGWAWVYEPFDANGYIPDFLLTGPLPVLVEVKPAANEPELRQHTSRLAEALKGVWTRDTLIVGAAPHGIISSRTWNGPCLGLMWEGSWWPEQDIIASDDSPGDCWDAAVWMRCGPRVSLAARAALGSHARKQTEESARQRARLRREAEDLRHLTFVHEIHSETPRPCGHDKDHTDAMATTYSLDRHWANACNETRWMPAR